MKREEATQLIETGLKNLHTALAKGQSDELRTYLVTMSRFHKYSFGNVMLILSQCPTAMQVAGFHAWLDIGRCVKKGAKGIGVIAPMVFKNQDKKQKKGSTKADTEEETTVRFKVVHVFDISQTEGEDLPELTPISGNPGDRLVALEAVVAKLDIELEYAPMTGTAQGVSKQGEIVIDESLPPGERFAVLVHEVAHELLHDKKRRLEETKAVLETEAEAVAFVVCHAVGLETANHSSDYIQLHRGDEQTLANSLDAIQKVSKTLLTELESIVPAGKFEPASTEPAPTSAANSEEFVEEELVVGRADYQQRREARIERYQQRAAQAKVTAESTFHHALKMADHIPLGQPILVGHHSEGRHRRHLAKIDNAMRKSCELDSKAKHYAGKAWAAEHSGAISSDDPEAVVKLKEKLADLKDDHERMKAVNAAWRQADKPLPDDKEGWQRVAELLGDALEQLQPIRQCMATAVVWSGWRPFESYALQNSSAEMRRVKERIQSFRDAQSQPDVDKDYDCCRLLHNREQNRVQLIFPGKPTEEIRKLLKEHGFRWARSAGAWQRLLNNNGRRAADIVVAKISAMNVSEVESNG